MIPELLKETEGKMRKACEALRKELAGLRTGRASPALVDHLQVDYYGALTPLNRLANISVPEPRLLVVQPWESQLLVAIEKAILKSDLGLNPSNDGRVIRLSIPQLTDERRRELVRLVRKKIEEGRVAIRNLRRDVLEELRVAEKEKLISEDEGKRAAESLQKLTDRFITEVDAIGEAKEAEVLEV